MDPGRQIRGRGWSSRPWDKGGGGGGGAAKSPKIFFRPFGPQFGLWIRGGPGPLGPYPRSVTATVHTYPVKTVSENASFQKHSPDRRFLKCRLIVWTITEVFEYDIMMSYIIQRMPCKACNRISILRSVFVWTGKNDSNTLRVEGYFFYNGQKNLLFQKYPDTCGRGLKVRKNNCKKEFTVRLFGQETHGRLIKKCLGCLTRLKCPEFRGKVLINFI